MSVPMPKWNIKHSQIRVVTSFVDFDRWLSNSSKILLCHLRWKNAKKSQLNLHLLLRKCVFQRLLSGFLKSVIQLIRLNWYSNFYADKFWRHLEIFFQLVRFNCRLCFFQKDININSFVIIFINYKEIKNIFIITTVCSSRFNSHKDIWSLAEWF